jgi:DNA-binding response OmpR family regulator
LAISHANRSHERESNVVTQLIFRIRRKIDPMSLYNPIETMRGGYRFATPRGRCT